ncbi:MAG: hypothetical protein CMH64_00710 [Nanoarchaeota archaeon]|nr:hypothetical protein [Nanoarchaeota archaeon]|tara:strand:- start:942 stop:1244 length:303 start_codon:yes stop_codon:yes gene_type:complete
MEENGFYQVLNEMVEIDDLDLTGLLVLDPLSERQSRQTLIENLRIYNEALGEIIDYLEEHPEIAKDELVRAINTYGMDRLNYMAERMFLSKVPDGEEKNE